MLLELLRLAEGDLSPVTPGRQRAEAEGTATEVQQRAAFSEVWDSDNVNLILTLHN